MSNIFPSNGLAPGVNNSGIDLDNAPGAGCVARYYNEQCSQRVDPRSTNAIISEMVSVFNECPDFVYDCAAVDNLLRAMQCLFAPAGSVGRIIAHGLPQTFLNATTCTITGWSATDENTFANSTFSGGTLTVGAGDAGSYLFHFDMRDASFSSVLEAAGTDSPNAPYGCILRLLVNGSPQAYLLATPMSGSNTLSAWSATGLLNLAEDDVVTMDLYWSRTGSSTGAAIGHFMTDTRTKLTIIKK